MHQVLICLSTCSLALTGCCGSQEGLTVDYIQGLSLAPGAKLYIQGGRLYVDGSPSDLAHPMTVLFADYIHSIMLQVCNSC